MGKDTAAKVISVVRNVILLPAVFYLWVFAVFLLINFEPFPRPEKVIHAQDFAAGMGFLAAAVAIPIAANLLIRLLWHRKRGISGRWTLIPAIAIPSVELVMAAIMCIERSEVWFTRPWVW